MKVYYDKDASLEIIKEKKNNYYWLWKSGTCSRGKLER